MTKNELKEKTLGLCEEDYYGAWELYWNYKTIAGNESVDDDLFIACLEELVADKKVVSYLKNKYDGVFEQAPFDVGRLRSELNEIKEDNITEDVYWFSHS